MPSCPKCGVFYRTLRTTCGLDGAELLFRVADPLIGRRFDGLEIVEPLGGTYVGRTYRATADDGPVVVKVLFGEVLEHSQWVARWAKDIRHPPSREAERFVPVLRAGPSSLGFTCSVAPLFSSGSFADRLSRAGASPAADAATLAREVAIALDALHDASRVMGRLRPTKVIVDGEGFRLNDLSPPPPPELIGAEQRVPGDELFERLPSEPYSAPEGVVSPASDMYLLGVLLYEALFGTPPFAVPGFDRRAPRRPPLDFGGLTDIAMGLLSPDPTIRPSAKIVIGKLDATGLARPVERARASARPRLASVKPRAASVLPHAVAPGGPMRGLAVAVGAVALAGAAVFVVAREKAPPARPAVEPTPVAVAPPPLRMEDILDTEPLGEPSVDAGLVAAAPPEADAGRDAGQLAPDAGRDAGQLAPDAGRDAGQLAPDAAPLAASARDAGPGTPDGGRAAPPKAPTPDLEVRKRAYARLDNALGLALARAGVEATALGGIVPNEWRQWGRWYGHPEELPEAAVIEKTQAALVAAAERLRPQTKTSTQ